MVEATLKMPPPYPILVGARGPMTLLLNVLFITVTFELRLDMTPPHASPACTRFESIVQFRITAVLPFWLCKPPPIPLLPTLTRLPVTLQAVRRSLPLFKIPPPIP